MSPKPPPVLFHYFKTPIPYQPSLLLQQKIHELQLARRKTSPSTQHDVLLLLQHRPVYTGGRRQNEEELSSEQSRLRVLGADWVPTSRGGQTTYHGPGQLVAYPLFDLGRMSLSVRCYVDRLERIIQSYAAQHQIPRYDSEHTGFFPSPTTKLGSIGVQVRHRLTTHGLSINITREPISWFKQVVACGLDDVSAVPVQDESRVLKEEERKRLSVEGEVPAVLNTFGELFSREFAHLKEHDEELYGLVRGLEREAEESGSWLKEPLSSTRIA